MHQELIDFFPITPGFKDQGAGRDAAREVGHSDKRAITLNRIMYSLRRQGPATADEIAARLDLDRLYVRPRVSELKTLGRIVDTGERRRNNGGRFATVWASAR